MLLLVRYSKYSKHWRNQRKESGYDKNHEDRATIYIFASRSRKEKKKGKNKVSDENSAFLHLLVTTEWTDAETNVDEDERRTAGVGTKPQCQPIDLRCSLRGPLLRREKNKLIGKGGGREAEERRSERQKRDREREKRERERQRISREAEIALFMNEKKKKKKRRRRNKNKEKSTRNAKRERFRFSLVFDHVRPANRDFC